MAKKKKTTDVDKSLPVKWCEVRPVECDGQCTYAKCENKKGSH